METNTWIQRLIKGNKVLKTQDPGIIKLFLILNSLFCFLTVSGQIVRVGAGPNAASVTAIRDAFRADLGGGITGAANGSFGGLRREINWDGVPDAFASPNSFPPNFFNANSPRGVVFSTPGTGFQVSANAGVAPVEFGNINPPYQLLFQPFSAQRLFTAIGSNITDVTFFIPGTTTPALTRGFGAIFSDVDLPNITSIQYFDRNNVSLGTFGVPPFFGDETFSFLGVFYPTPIIARARITSGNRLLGPVSIESFPLNDLVVMDDFIYGEPVPAFVCPTITVTIPDAYVLSSGVLTNTAYVGYAPASSITLTSTVSGGTSPYNYTWSTGSNADAITVSPTVNTTYSLSVSDANRCTGSVSKTVNVIDVRGGKDLDKVVICHKPGKKEKILTIGEEGVADHLGHGDMLGSCSSSSDRLRVGRSTSDAVSISKGNIKQGSQVSSLITNLYPNPSAKYFTLTVKGSNSEAIRIRVLDMQGQLIEQKDNLSPGQTFKFGDSYKPGTYILETIQGSIKKQQKIIKNHY